MLRVRLSLLLVLVLASVQSFSVDKYWRPVDNSFHNAANWDPVGIPGPSDRVIFDQFGTWDCVVYLDASVGGHLQYNNYTGIVSLQPGVHYTVGTTGFWMDSGGFYSNEQDLDVNGSLEIHGGGFLASSATTHVAGNLELNPWPLGGWFTDAGIIMIDGSAYTTLVSDINVKHLQMNKQFGYNMTIPAGMNLTVSEQFDFMDGVIQGPGKIQILKDCSIESGSDGGTVPFWFTGNVTNHVIMDKNNHDCGGFYVAKSTNVDSVIVTSSIGELLFMHSSDSLVLQSGVLDFQHPLVHLQQKVTQLQPMSTFLASEYLMYLERDWDNDGGTFMHRNGKVIINGSNYSTYSFDTQEVFWNVDLNKPSGYTLTLSGTDKLVVENKMTCVQGALNGSTSWLSIVDTLHYTSGFGEGSAQLEFVGNQTNHFIIDHTTNLLNHIEINKTSPTDSVIMETNLAHLQLGDNATDNIYINNGVLAFAKCGNHVDWNVHNLHLMAEGTFLCWPGTTYFSQNIYDNGGMFKHNNGLFVADGSNYANYDVNDHIRFHNYTIQKPGGYSVNLAGADSLIAENKYTSISGTMNGASALILALDTVHIQPTHAKGSTNLAFGGNVEGNFIFDQTTIGYNLISINKDVPSTTVWFETNNPALSIGNVGNEDLDIERGTIRFQNVGTHVDWNFRHVDIESEGTLVAYEGDTYSSGNMYELGGAFQHNNGNWVWDGSNYSTIDVLSEIQFYNLEMNKPSGYDVTFAPGDSVRVFNKYTSIKGLLNGTTALLLVNDTALILSTHAKGSIHMEFSGPTEGHCIFNQNSSFFNDVRIKKDAPETTLWFETTNPQLTIGNIGSEDLNIIRGTIAFQNVGNHVDWNWRHVYIQPDGRFNAYNGTTYSCGNMHELGGQFNHSNGTWVWDGSNNATIDGLSEIQFHNLEMNKPPGYAMTISGDDSLRVFNKYISTRGNLNGPSALLLVEDSALIANTHAKGNTHIEFSGPGDGHCIFNQNSAFFNDVRVKKDAPEINVWFETTTPELTIGNIASEDLNIIRGTVAFQNVGNHVDWNWRHVYIQPDGRFNAYNGTTYSCGNMHELGGQFNHSNGAWIWDGTYNSTIDGLSEIQFFNLEMNKPTGYAMTISGDDSLRVFNKYHSIRGNLNGPNALLLVEDSTVIASTHNEGSTPLEFAGPGDAWLINNSGSQFFNVFRINKSNDADIVWFEAGSGDLTLSALDDVLYLDKGVLAFQNYGSEVNWNAGNTYIQGGTLRAPELVFNFRYNIHFDSGGFENNMGDFQFVGSNYSNITGSFVPSFYNVFWNKPTGYTSTIVAPQYVTVENQCSYINGGLQGGALHANGNVLVSPSWSGGNSPLIFDGSTDQLFDLTGGEGKFEAVIEINKPSGVVELQSDLIIEDNFPQLVLTSGLLTSADPVEFNPFFSNVSNGWSGGNDDSYIACPALVSGFGTAMVPVGDDGVFAPAGIGNASTMATYRIAYQHSDPNVAFGASVTAPIDHIAQCEHWTVSVDSGTPTAKIHLSYDTDRCGAIDIPSELVVSAWNSGLATWESTGQSSDDGSKIGGATVPNDWMAFTLGSTTPNNPMNGSTGPCAGDFNTDGVVDTNDLLSFLGGFGCTGTCVHDLTGDGEVNTADLLQFLGLFGTVCS